MMIRIGMTGKHLIGKHQFLRTIEAHARSLSYDHKNQWENHQDPRSVSLKPLRRKISFLPQLGLVQNQQIRCISFTHVLRDEVKQADAKSSSSEPNTSPDSTVSTDTSSTTESLIPDKPVPLDDQTLGFAGEPPLESLGLASWWPTGRAQYLMENIHVGLDVPWWGTILSTAILIRAVLFPLSILSQKNSVNMSNNMPGLQVLQTKMSEARRRGDLYEASSIGMEMQQYMNEKEIKPLRSFIPMFLQIPIFLSMYFGLRGMCYLPVESMTTGGCLWFQDLTVADPYYILPLITSLSLFAQIKLGSEGISLSQASGASRYILMAMPFVIFPFTMNFPAAITFYWMTSNLLSLIIARIIRMKGVREKLGVPKIKQIPMEEKAKKQGPKKSFRESIRDAVDNFKVQADAIDRREFDEKAFREAGIEKTRRTYKFDPTRPRVTRR